MHLNVDTERVLKELIIELVMSYGVLAEGISISLSAGSTPESFCQIGKEKSQHCTELLFLTRAWYDKKVEGITCIRYNKQKRV
jgi:hypothetical protein